MFKLGSSPSWVKPKTMILVFDSSPLIAELRLVGSGICVIECSDMSIHRLLFQYVSTIKIHFNVLF